MLTFSRVRVRENQRGGSATKSTEDNLVSEEVKTMFRTKEIRELVAAVKSVVLLPQETEYRPCYVNGRKALFHRWVNTANPALPKGMDPKDERAKFFQHRSTTGLVEFENGVMARAWPQEIRFADGGRFDKCEWLSLEQLEAK